ncbi:MAG: cyclophilin-like fold protein [Candidatus Diapherotrites archaeon]
MPQKQPLKYHRLKFSLPKFSFYAKLLPSKNSELVHELLDNLPITGYAERWGEEIYFTIDALLAISNPIETKSVGVGDIAFWVPGSAIAIFFGSTPMSKGSKPVPASAVGIFARIDGLKAILEDLRHVKHMDKIVVSGAK